MENKQIDRIIEIEQFLSTYEGPDKVVEIGDLKTVLEKENAHRTIYSSGFPSLDRQLKGFRDGELIVISGPTKHGKTTFMQMLTINLEKSGKKSLWFSFDTPPIDVIERFYELPERPLVYMPSMLKDKNLLWLENRIYEAKLKFDAKFIFIDHLGFLFDFEKSRNTSIEMGELVRKLKSLAIKHNIIIFVSHHLRKVDLDKEVDETDLRDSSLVSADADGTFMIYRKRIKLSREERQQTGDQYRFTNESILKICNYRRAGNSMGVKIPLIFDGKFLREVSYVQDSPPVEHHGEDDSTVVPESQKLWNEPGDAYPTRGG